MSLRWLRSMTALEAVVSVTILLILGVTAVPRIGHYQAEQRMTREVRRLEALLRVEPIGQVCKGVGYAIEGVAFRCLPQTGHGSLLQYYGSHFDQLTETGVALRGEPIGSVVRNPDESTGSLTFF